MTITAAIVLFSVTWFMVFFCVLPFRYKSQAEAGEVTPGTPASAPAEAMIGQKAKVTTWISIAVFAALYLIITSGFIHAGNMDFLGIMKGAEQLKNP